MSADERFMARAIELARTPAFTSPNPRVGAVVVRDGEIVSEGYHRGPGHPHAEVEALRGIDATGATLYVNLEPCTHEGRTPPCAPQVAHSGVTRVVIGTVDPFPTVAGRGIELLRDAGIEVTTGVLESDCESLNLPFLHRHRTGRALLTLKLAVGLNGKMGAPDGGSRWITSAETRRYVHERRQEADAVMVGVGTIVGDDPELSVREMPAERHPLKIVLDAHGRTPADARVFSSDGDLLIATTMASSHEQHTRWKEAGAEVMVVTADGHGHPDIDELLRRLADRDVLEVFSEGGPRVATSLLTDGHVDRFEVHMAPVVLGTDGAGFGDASVAAMDDATRYRLAEVKRIGPDVIAIYERAA